MQSSYDDHGTRVLSDVLNFIRIHTMEKVYVFQLSYKTYSEKLRKSVRIKVLNHFFSLSCSCYTYEYTKYIRVIYAFTRTLTYVKITFFCYILMYKVLYTQEHYISRIRATTPIIVFRRVFKVGELWQVYVMAFSHN